MATGDISWMDTYLEAYFTRLKLSIQKLCTMKGIGHLADEVTGEVLLILCQKHSEYNPARGSFITWSMWHARCVVHRMIDPSRHQRYGGENSANVSMEYEHMFAESEPLPFSDDGDPLFAVRVEFDDPFEKKDMSGTQARLFLGKLTDGERACLELLLKDGRVRYRQLGQRLGVSHTQAGKLLPDLMQGLKDKARECLQQ